jgi:hypothetical protein
MKRSTSLAALTIATAAISAAGQAPAPPAHAKPAPEVEYLYNVTVRRHYNFPNGDALGYGYGICDNVTRGTSYAQMASNVRNDLATNDEYDVTYLISNAVDTLCPAQIWQLRNSAQHYRPPTG